MRPPTEALRAFGASGFAVSRIGVKLRAGDDVPARTCKAVSAGRTWAVLDSGGGGADSSWMAGVHSRLATVLVVDAERTDALRTQVMAAAGVLGRFPDGVLLRDAAHLAQERAWPAVTELVEEGRLRCAGLVTTRSAVLERCASWRSVDAVLVPADGAAADANVTALIEACRWSGVAVIRDCPRAAEVVVDAPLPSISRISPTKGGHH